MRYSAAVRHERRILCVFPAYSPSFGTFSHAYPLMDRVRAFMPPQGLLVIAAYLPERWQIRFVDENLSPARAADFAWADVVLVTGMHIQATQIRAIAARARAAGKVTVLGGPSASAMPESYPEFDYLHIGEIGCATDRLIEHLDASIAAPAGQVRLTTQTRLPLAAFPQPAYHLIPLDRYFIGSVQFSSGCPYTCEFCDIPGLYGRVPRMKTPQQVMAELDAMLVQARPPAVYFVDDNFIGNRKATATLLPHLIAWQKCNGYPLRFACEATLNLAKEPEILAMMREAHFITVFVGIETPEIATLERMSKKQNTRVPILDAVATLNSYGIEVVSGIIQGLDGETADSGRKLLEFVERSRIPMLTINLLQALPGTPLWARLAREDRIDLDPALESNVRFARPYAEVVATWKHCIAETYRPERLFERFIHQINATYPNRIHIPASSQLSARNLRRGFILALNLAVRLGVLADYRRVFWRAVWHALRHGQIESAFNMGLVAHHLITFAREAVRGEQKASFYQAQARDEPDEPAADAPVVFSEAATSQS
ncbi:MAG: B12-binding domain-containing radical SAM protein [Defluviicoccus sp.]